MRRPNTTYLIPNKRINSTCRSDYEDIPNRHKDQETPLSRTRSAGSSRSVITLVEASIPSHFKQSPQFIIPNPPEDINSIALPPTKNRTKQTPEKDKNTIESAIVTWIGQRVVTKTKKKKKNKRRNDERSETTTAGPFHREKL
ncbi:hypothetical protein BHE74_00029461 [Ensete ventricosum]|nr:hypothetical protein GW17_00035565 [Ensete ventricosum]RWW63366.1 hypothetical protein BHE74_00029461 [Ensete ventricosum]